MNWLPAEALASDIRTEQDVENAHARVPESEVLEGDGRFTRIFSEIGHQAYTLPHLLPRLTAASAVWRYINFGYQLKFVDGTILSWWPRTGAIAWQGTLANVLPRPGKAEGPGAALDAYLSYTAQQKPPRTVSDIRVCQVCGGAHVPNTCASCARIQTDLCAVCFPRAHWC